MRVRNVRVCDLNMNLWFLVFTTHQKFLSSPSPSLNPPSQKVLSSDPKFNQLSEKSKNSIFWTDTVNALVKIDVFGKI